MKPLRTITYLSLLLAIALILAACGANNTVAPTEQPAAEPAEEPAEEPAQEADPAGEEEMDEARART